MTRYEGLADDPLADDRDRDSQPDYRAEPPPPPPAHESPIPTGDEASAGLSGIARARATLAAAKPLPKGRPLPEVAKATPIQERLCPGGCGVDLRVRPCECPAPPDAKEGE
jgi:hypothetical protein